ncbi:MAG: ribulose bisphosphate carboxylase small subunit [Pseudomonadota bacterium]
MPASVHNESPCINLPDLDKLKSLIESSFTHDWVLRVEHTEEAIPEPGSWRQWGEALFAIREAAPVMNSIATCRDKHPQHNIRLNVEKLRPRTRMLYCVHRAPQSVPASMTPETISKATLINRFHRSDGNAGYQVRNHVWKMIYIVGMLLASLLLIEEAMV